MAKVRIEFETDNEAFRHLNSEVQRVLTQARAYIVGGHDSNKLMDSNGNTIGKVEVTE